MRHNWTAIVIGLATALAWCAAGVAQEGAVAGGVVDPLADAESAPIPLVYYCPRADGMILIDGQVDDEAWDATVWSSDFVDILGWSAPAPRYVTAVKLLWDSENLYVAAVLEETQLQGSIAVNDSANIHVDNEFAVLIDPDGDTQHYLELNINTFNAVWDLLWTRTPSAGGLELRGWDFTGLRSGVLLGGTLNDDSDLDDGWIVELAIPWSAMKEAAGTATPPAAGDYWRMNFSRIQWPLEYDMGTYRKVTDPLTGELLMPGYSVWTPQGVRRIYLPEHWGYIVFTDDGEGAWVNPPNLPSEIARQSLYTLYHAEQDYAEATGSYTWDPALLAGYVPVADYAPEGGLITPAEWAAVDVYLHPDGFLARQPLPAGGEVWIDHTGRSWVVPAGEPETSGEEPAAVAP